MSKIIPQYCYIKIPDAIYILHTRPPFYIGRVWLYKSLPALNEQIEKLGPIAYAQLEHYKIAITIWNVLGGRLIVHASYKEEAQRIVNGMMEFYKEEAIKKSPKFYEKYLI